METEQAVPTSLGPYPTRTLRSKKSCRIWIEKICRALWDDKIDAKTAGVFAQLLNTQRGILDLEIEKRLTNLEATILEIKRTQSTQIPPTGSRQLFTFTPSIELEPNTDTPSPDLQWQTT